MRIFVTGVAGFIGSTLAARLIADSHDVVGVDNMSDYYDRSLKEANLLELKRSEQFTFIEGDLNSADLHTLLQDVEIIFHQAGQPGVRKSWGREFSHYVDANVSATQRLLEAARAHQGTIRRIVYASSSSVYGDAERFPTRESDRPQPRSPYGVTKLAAEHLVSLYASNFGLPTISLRYFTVYGPKQRPDMAFNQFISNALYSRPLTVHGDGHQIREFTFVDDIVEANVRAGLSECNPGLVINLSGGTSISVNEVLDLLASIHGAPLTISHGAPALGDVFRTGGSTELASSILGWRPQVQIADGLRRQYEWMVGPRE